MEGTASWRYGLGQGKKSLHARVVNSAKPLVTYLQLSFIDAIFINT